MMVVIAILLLVLLTVVVRCRAESGERILRLLFLIAGRPARPMPVPVPGLSWPGPDNAPEQFQRGVPGLNSLIRRLGVCASRQWPGWRMARTGVAHRPGRATPAVAPVIHVANGITGNY